MSEEGEDFIPAELGVPNIHVSNIDGSTISNYNPLSYSNNVSAQKGKNCIIPGTLFGATPYDVTFQGGFGGRPGIHTVKFVNPDGEYDIDIRNIDLNISTNVGISSLIREQVLTDFEIDQSIGGKILTARFQDKKIIDLQRHLIVCRQLVKFGSFSSKLIGDRLGTGCVSVYGTVYHKAPGAPNRLDSDTLRLGPSPTIYIGGDADGNTGGRNSHGPEYKKISEEYVFYNSTWIASDPKLQRLIGPGLKQLLASDPNPKLKFLSTSGNALDIIVSLAGACKWFLYANAEGQLDALNELPRITKAAATRIGSQCSIRSIKEKVSITNTKDMGGWATWLHDDNYLKEFNARFLGVDLLGIPLPVCDPENPAGPKDDSQAKPKANGPQNAGNGDGSDEITWEDDSVRILMNSKFTSMYFEGMSDKYISQLKRLLKMSVLDSIWQNWQGLSVYIHLKRLRENKVKGEVKLFSPQAVKSDASTKLGHNIKMKCVQSGVIKVKGGDRMKISPNNAVNKLFPCLFPAILDYEHNSVKAAFDKVLLNDGSNKNQEIKPPRGGGRQILALDAGQNLECLKLKNDKEAPGPNGADSPLKGQVQGGQWAGGAAADRAELLTTLALSVGRWWVLADGRGNGGGGASLMTERQHSYRTYHPPHGNLIWYDKRLSVRNTVFSGIYERIYGDRLKEWELTGGIRRKGTIQQEKAREEAIAAGKEYKDTFDRVSDLSVTQFLQLAYRMKYRNITGDKGGVSDELEEEEAFKNGEGMESDEIAAANLKAKELCARGEPKGIVVWDSLQKEPELPLQNEWMASIAGGVDTKVDKTGPDVVRYVMQQVTLGVIMNPMKTLKNVVKTKKGLEENAAAADSLDQSLDNIILNQDLENIGKKRYKTIKFEALRARHFYSQHIDLPNCNSQAFKFQFQHQKLDGQILWRTLDCYGNTEPWRSLNEGINWFDIGRQLSKAVRDMVDQELDPESSYSVTTCGQSTPNLPAVEQGLQSYTVTIQKDGSVMTTFQLSREAIRAAGGYNAALHQQFNYSMDSNRTDYSMHIPGAETNSADLTSFDINQQSLQSSVKLHNGNFSF